MNRYQRLIPEEKRKSAIEKIAKAQEMIFDALNDSYGLSWKNDPNFKDTPERIARAMIDEKCVGINSFNDCIELLNTTFPTYYREMIICANPITAYGICPHHFENITYKVYMAYNPEDKCCGLSKPGRVIKLFARQPLLQEDFTINLAKIFQKALSPRGLALIVKGQHNCMICRGLSTESDQWVITSHYSGKFTLQDGKVEFLRLCQI